MLPPKVQQTIKRPPSLGARLGQGILSHILTLKLIEHNVHNSGHKGHCTVLKTITCTTCPQHTLGIKSSHTSCVKPYKETNFDLSLKCPNSVDSMQYLPPPCIVHDLQDGVIWLAQPSQIGVIPEILPKHNTPIATPRCRNKLFKLQIIRGFRYVPWNREDYCVDVINT